MTRKIKKAMNSGFWLEAITLTQFEVHKKFEELRKLYLPEIDIEEVDDEGFADKSSFETSMLSAMNIISSEIWKTQEILTVKAGRDPNETKKAIMKGLDALEIIKKNSDGENSVEEAELNTALDVIKNIIGEEPTDGTVGSFWLSDFYLDFVYYYDNLFIMYNDGLNHSEEIQKKIEGALSRLRIIDELIARKKNINFHLLN